MATLDILVNYSTSTQTFSYALSYDYLGTTYIDSVDDGGTVAFVNSGQYTLTNESNPNDSQTFTFDSVSVSLASGLGTSCECNCTGQTFSVSGIGFPSIPPGDTSQEDAYTWCQETPSEAAAQSASAKRFLDPKLGLSNNTGGTQIIIPSSSFESPCDCNCSGSCS